MILPQTYLGALLLLILSMICWGSWANTYKFAGKWRFELYYFDYAFGVLLMAAICAFTFGSQPTSEGLEFLDDLSATGRRQIFYGFGAGAVFNLANMLLVASISLAGMAVAFPVGIGTALVVGVVWNYAIQPKGNPGLLFVGVALIALAIVVDALAYHKHAETKLAEEAKAPKPKAPKKKAPPIKAIILSVVSGLLMGSFFPLLEMGKAGDLGLGPYAISFVFSVGVFLTTFVFNLFFMNLPVQGSAVEFRDYFRGKASQHLLGVLGGALWFTGMIGTSAVASATAKDAQVGPAVSYALAQGATMVSALWGLLLWREFEGSDMRVKSLIIVMLVLFLSGLGLVSMAPLYGV